MVTKRPQLEYPSPAESTAHLHSRSLIGSITLVPFRIRTHHHKIGVLAFVSLLENFEIMGLIKKKANYDCFVHQQ